MFRITTQVQPILLKGHERSITQCKFNPDGDLLYTTAKDSNPTVWNGQTGQRLGTFVGHKGAVWDLDMTHDSQFVVTGGGDGVAILWNGLNGEQLASYTHRGAVRSVRFSQDSRTFITAQDAFTSRELANISIFGFDPEDPTSSDGLPRSEIVMQDLVKATCVDFTLLDRHIVASLDADRGDSKGALALYDPETGQEVQRAKIHEDRINRFTYNAEKTMFITASRDRTAKIIDPKTLEVVKTYTTDRPVNAAVISPLKYHVLLGGGQDAMSVTVTSSSQGKFETRFFHTIYEQEFGRIGGHFGPINALAIHPTGRIFASGAEDGYIRLHHLDEAYLNSSDHIPPQAYQPEGQAEEGAAAAAASGDADGGDEA